MIDDLLAATPAPTVAARFHQTLANMTHDACCAIRQETGLKRVVLSGGVWQNRTLAMRSERRLRASGFELFTPRLVPANDGGLALGQAVAAAAMFANGLDGYTSTL